MKKVLKSCKKKADPTGFKSEDNAPMNTTNKLPHNVRKIFGDDEL